MKTFNSIGQSEPSTTLFLIMVFHFFCGIINSVLTICIVAKGVMPTRAISAFANLYVIAGGALVCKCQLV